MFIHKKKSVREVIYFNFNSVAGSLKKKGIKYLHTMLLIISYISFFYNDKTYKNIKVYSKE